MGSEHECHSLVGQRAETCVPHWRDHRFTEKSHGCACEASAGENGSRRLKTPLCFICAIGHTWLLAQGVDCLRGSLDRCNLGCHCGRCALPHVCWRRRRPIDEHAVRAPALFFCPSLVKWPCVHKLRVGGCEGAVRFLVAAKKRCREEQRLVLELPGHPEHCVVPHVVQDALTATKSDAVCRTVGDAVCDCANAFGIAAWAQAWHGWRKQSGAGGE
jgi:hypothetical protein